MKVAEYIQKNKEAMPPELAEMLTQETSIWSNDACYGYMIIAMRNAGYKEKDITNLSNYSKEITKDNLNKSKIIEQNEISLESKQKEINRLNTEIKNLKSGKTLQDKDKIIDGEKIIWRKLEPLKKCDEGISYSEIYTYNEGSDLENFKEE